MKRSPMPRGSSRLSRGTPLTSSGQPLRRTPLKSGGKLLKGSKRNELVQRKPKDSGQSAADFIMERVAKDPSGCWLWIGVILGTGYGQTERGGGKKYAAHRYSYETFVGPIPPGLTIDHLCGVRRCVNPEHMEPVTRAENVRRSGTNPVAMNLAKTTCKRGHEFDHVDSRGWRKCSTCINERRRERRQGAPARGTRQRTHCPQGHPYDEENTRIGKDGRRACRTCARTRWAAYGMGERTARKIVRARSGGVCELCQKQRATDVHHRKNRSQGGLWEPQNLLHLCHDEHMRITTSPALSYERGWSVRSGHDPATQPVWLAGHGWSLLRADGSVAPYETSAA